MLLSTTWRMGGFGLLAGLQRALHRDRLDSCGGGVLAADGQPPPARGAVLAGYLATAPAWSARPQMFSVLLFAVEVYVLEVARTRPRIALAIPLLMPLWANLHGAFAVGLGLFAVEAITAVWRRDRQGVLRFLAVGVISLIGLLANPWGAGCSPMPRGCPPTR